MDKNVYQVLHNETFGRYMAAKRSIKQGELILKENPLIVGPQIGGKPICFKCCTFIVKDQLEICRQCETAIICRQNCSGSFHTNEECVELFKLKIDKKLLKNNDEIVTPLRSLLRRNYSTELWKEINDLESHIEDRRNTMIWKRNQLLVENVLKGANIISQEDISEEIIQKICGVLDVNSFEIRPPQNKLEMIINPETQCLRGLYLKAALMAHNCVANTHLAVDDDFNLFIHASLDIEKGSPIFFNYSNVLQSNSERKKHLKEGKYFECTCNRCLDPSELNTNISSLKCHKCRNGIIQPKLEGANGAWFCTSCSSVFSKWLIESTLRQARNLIEDKANSNTMELERLNTKLLQTLHPNHFLMLELKQTLVGMYTQDVPSRKNLSRKIDLCYSLIKVFQILEPGLSRIQGVTLYELHSAIANLAYKEYSQKEISLEILSQRLMSSEATLKAALKHLIYEPKKSPEGSLAHNALGYLKMLRESISDIEVQLAAITRITTKDKKKKNKTC